MASNITSTAKHQQLYAIVFAPVIGKLMHRASAIWYSRNYSAGTHDCPKVMALNQTRKHVLKQDWFIITSLVSKDFKLKYRRSVLGVVWSVLNPLLMMCVLTAVFSTFFRFQIEYYPFYLILGNTLFAFVMESGDTGMRSIIQSASLLRKISVNKFIFPIERVLFALVNFAVSLIAVIIVMLFLQIPPTINLIFLPLLLLYSLLFSMGLAFILSTLAVFFRDMLHIWGVAQTVWMYATPIFYPSDILPNWMLTLEAFNPMYHYITYFRDIALWGNTPSLAENGICLLFGVITLAVGLLVFQRQQDKFVLYT